MTSSFPRWAWATLAGLGPLALFTGGFIGWAVDPHTAVPQVSYAAGLNPTTSAFPAATTAPTIALTTTPRPTHVVVHTVIERAPALAPFIPPATTAAPATAAAPTSSAAPSTTAAASTSVVETTGNTR